MNIDINFISSIAATFIMIGISWGILSAKVNQLKEHVQQIEKTRPTNERIQTVLTKLEGLETRILDRFEQLDHEIRNLRGEKR